MVPPDSEPPAPSSHDAPERDPNAALHETTNALTVVLGWIERAKQARADLDAVFHALERASNTAMATRNALRRAIGATVAEEPPERVDALAQRALDDLLIEARRAEVALQLRIEPECAAWTIDHAHAAWQILTNLLLNAIAATPTGGAVHLLVEASSEPHRPVTFSVVDEGPGVPADSRDQLFREGVSGRAGGAGIGLWHARAIAREHDARLDWVEVDEGARFDLHWPCSPTAAPNPGRTAAEPADRPRGGTAGTAGPRPLGAGGDARGKQALRGHRVLLLEDDAAIVELLELSLATGGATLTTVSDTAALPAAIRQHRVDTLLVDLSPVGSDLDALLEQARAENPDLVVIVISGRPEQPSRATAWVRKPFEPSELVAAIVEAHRSRPAS